MLEIRGIFLTTHSPNLTKKSPTKPAANIPINVRNSTKMIIPNPGIV